MRIRLPVKIFLAFLTVAVVSISMVGVANYYFSKRNFASYLRFKGEKTLAVFAETLAEIYQTYLGWETLKNQPDLWASLILERWPSDENIPTATGTDDFLGTDVSRATEIAVSVLPYPTKASSEDASAYGRLYPHVSLYNSEKEWIVGEERAFEDAYTLPITVAGDTVGWVGLVFGEKLTHPLDLEFMGKQSRVFHIIGAVVLLVSIAIAFLLTKHLLSPIKRFSEAAEALGERDFKTRIPVLTKDELGALARQFNTMAQKLEIYERNQKQWISDIAHELRTPLAILTGEIKALQEGVRKPDETSLSSLSDEAKHLSKIVGDLHYLSLSEAGDAPMAMDIIKPLPVLSQAVYFFKTRLEENGISLNFHLDPESADFEMTGDRDRLMQLFTNLLENTLMHADQPGELTIRQANTEGKIKISFEDTGPGVSQQDLPRLFERLYRADPSRSRQTGSTGLGLSICKSIVENHKGTISASHSELGGLRIDIHLPLLTDENCREPGSTSGVV
jgi:two-component system sensor histidine kinase BaeS